MSNYPRAFLVDNPPARRQFRDRYARPTGCIVLHTAESQPDEVGPDTGAENVARFLQGRSTPGSYHDLADSDSDVHCVRYAKAAYGDGTGSNEWAIHLSLATQAHRWATLPKAWREAAVINLARCAARANRWLVANGYPSCPPRRISRAQSEAGEAGFITHAQRDPDRRTDPGKDFPWDLFLSTYAALIGGTDTRPDPEDDMTPEQANQLDFIYKRLEAITPGPRRRNPSTGEQARLLDERHGDYIVRQIVAGHVDVDALAAAIVAKIPAGEAIDRATVKAGVLDALRAGTEE